MRYDHLSNTLTFVQEHNDASNLLTRLVNELRLARGVSNFQVIGPRRTRITRRKIVKLVFATATGAETALKWIEQNFEIR